MDNNSTLQLIAHTLSKDTGFSPKQAFELITGLQPFNENTINTLISEREISGEDQAFWKGLARIYSDRQLIYWETLLPLDGLGIARGGLYIWETLENILEEIAIKKYHDPIFIEELHRSKVRTSLAYVVPLPIGMAANQCLQWLREGMVEDFLKNGHIASYALLWNNEKPYGYIQVSFKVATEDDKPLTNLIPQELSPNTQIEDIVDPLWCKIPYSFFIKRIQEELRDIKKGEVVLPKTLTFSDPIWEDLVKKNVNFKPVAKRYKSSS